MPHHITKTRYAKLVELVKSIIPDDESKCEQIMNGICNIFEFDPNASTYTPRHAAEIVKSRKKLQEQGISIYVSSGKKRFDEKKKALALENIST
jgi:mitochondrial fission protein ELM1